MNMQMNTKRILIFLAFAVGIPWITALASSQTSLMKNNPVVAVALVNYVFITTPALANVATRLITREGWKRVWLWPNLRRGWRFYLAAWLLPFPIAIIGSLIYYLLFPQSFDPNFTLMRDLLTTRGTTSVAAASSWTVILTFALQQIILQGLIAGIVVGLGEEFGWRAYLLQRLMDRFHDARKAALLVGVIHGVWHWPLIYIGTVLNPGGVTFLALMAYLVFTCSLSIFLSWCTLRSGSVWPAAIGHTSVLGGSGVGAYMGNGSADMLLGPHSMGLIGGLGFTALALVLLFNRKAFASETATQPESAPAVLSA